jgi:hypothetical protein
MKNHGKEKTKKTNPLGTVEKCNNLGWQIQPALIHLHFQCFHLAPSLLKMKKVIHLKETHVKTHVTPPTARAIWLHKASTPFRNHSWRTAVFSTVDLQGLFQDESGRSLLRLWQTVSNSVSLCFTPHQSDDFFYSLCPISTTAGFPCLK